MKNTVRKHIYFSGRVQGVGFRYRSYYIGSVTGADWMGDESLGWPGGNGSAGTDSGYPGTFETYPGTKLD